jgi:hypothetical protein
MIGLLQRSFGHTRSHNTQCPFPFLDFQNLDKMDNPFWKAFLSPPSERIELKDLKKYPCHYIDHRFAKFLSSLPAGRCFGNPAIQGTCSGKSTGFFPDPWLSVPRLLVVWLYRQCSVQAEYFSSGYICRNYCAKRLLFL